MTETTCQYNSLCTRATQVLLTGLSDGSLFHPLGSNNNEQKRHRCQSYNNNVHGKRFCMQDEMCVTVMVCVYVCAL